MQRIWCGISHKPTLPSSNDGGGVFYDVVVMYAL